MDASIFGGRPGHHYSNPLELLKHGESKRVMLREILNSTGRTTAVLSFEHNPQVETRAAWNHEYELLRSGGLLVATFSVSASDHSGWDEEVAGYHLSLRDATEIWERPPGSDFVDVLETHNNRCLKDMCPSRFRSTYGDAPPHIACGVAKVSPLEQISSRVDR